jgi:UDP-glucose 4-epimerase
LKLLVTGGLGYIGGRFYEVSSARGGAQITLTSRRPAAAAQAARGATIAQVELTDTARLLPLCRGVDAVVHLSGMNAADCARDPVGAIESRESAVSALLRAAIEAGVPRLVYVSTAHVYGAALTGQVTEDTPARPQHAYARSHFAAEEIVRAARARGDIDAVVARLSNAFGAPVFPSAECWTLVANDLCRQAVRTHSMTLRTQGRQRRDFVPMSDVCRALLLFCDAPRGTVKFDTYNVGSGDAPTILELAERIAARTQARLHFRPAVVVGTAQDAVGEGRLDFRSDRLAELGFETMRGAELAELDRLIDFCASGEGSL